MLFCGISDRRHPPLLARIIIPICFGKHALYIDMCDLDSELTCVIIDMCCSEKMRHRNIVEVVCGDHLKKSTPCNFVNICNMGTTTSECSAHALPGKKIATCTVRHARRVFNITCLCIVCRIVRSDG